MKNPEPDTLTGPGSTGRTLIASEAIARRFEEPGRSILDDYRSSDIHRHLSWTLDIGRQGRASLRAAALLRTGSSPVAPDTIDYLGFAIPDMFVVGYGLDFPGRCRALPGIRVPNHEGTPQGGA